MADLFSWTDLGRWLASLTRRALPGRLLRLFWSDKKFLTAIDAFHFSQAPRFYLGKERDDPELHIVGFNVFNLTPFRFSIVGAVVRVSIDSRDLFVYDQRFSAEQVVDPYARGGFYVRHSLTDAQAARMRAYPTEWAAVRVDATMILKTPFGELRKSVMADVVAIISR